MKAFNLTMFWILIPISISLMLSSEFASFTSTVFFGIGNLITEASGLGSLEGSVFTTYAQVIGSSILASLPVILWGTFWFDEYNIKESKFMSKLGDFFFSTWWLFLIVEIGTLVGIYYWASSVNGLGSIEPTSGTEGFFGWLEDFGNNFANIYGWYVYPFFHIGLVGISLWLSSKAKTKVGQIFAFSILGLISIILIPSLYAVLMAVLGALLIIVVAGVIILGGLAFGGAILDDGKIHGHIDSYGNVTIDKY